MYNKAMPVLQNSYKSRRVARSALSAEAVSFAYLTDCVLEIWRQLELILKHPVPVHLLTDHKSFYDINSLEV